MPIQREIDVVILIPEPVLSSSTNEMFSFFFLFFLTREPRDAAPSSCVHQKTSPKRIHLEKGTKGRVFLKRKEKILSSVYMSSFGVSVLDVNEICGGW